MIPESKSSTAAAAVSSLSPHDVLFGRGSGPNLYSGNLQYRALVAEKKEAYTSSADVEEKRAVAQGILDDVQSKGGRFLQRRGGKTKSEDIVQTGQWFEVSDDIALAKVKQALREKSAPPASTSESVKENKSVKRNAESEGRVVSPPDEMASNGTYSAEHSGFDGCGGIESPTVPALSPSTRGVHHAAPPLLPSMMLPAGGTCIPPIAPVDARLLLFQSAPVALQQQPSMVSFSLPPSRLTNQQHLHQSLYPLTTVPEVYTSAGGASVPLTQNMLLQRSIHIAAASNNASQLYTQFRDSFQIQSAPTTPEPPSKESMEHDGENQIDALQENDSVAVDSASEEAKEDEIAAFLLQSLAISDRPFISAEQEARERESLSNDEKAAIMADAFGSYSSSGITPQSKKARKDLDKASIAFLVRLMRAEIDSIPAQDKPALIEAQVKARPEEFSDRRLELFLQTEGMNTKLAAERFVRYWEGRLKTFGPVKYLKRMTLSGALRDDLVALRTGMCSILPFPDAFGRQLVYLDFLRHTREGYSSESMLRAIWYTMEVLILQDESTNTGIAGGFVQVSWCGGGSIFDYDPKVFDPWAYFASQAWPIKTICSHVCCTPFIIAKIVRPIILSFSDKRIRTRTLMHDVPESEILDVLAKYGIEKSMLPRRMGGDVDLNPAEWIAQRRASEIEEL